MVGHWLSTPEPNPFADILARTPKYVVSRTREEELPYPNSTLLAGEAVETVRELLQQGEGSNLVVLGSGALVHDLAAAGLVDRYVLTTIPIVLGRGARLFPLRAAHGTAVAAVPDGDPRAGAAMRWHHHEALT